MARTADADPGSPVWRRADTAAYVESAERAVVLDLDRLDRPPYVLEGSAARIWALIDGDRSEAAVVAELAAVFQVAPDQLTLDVREFVERLRGLGLLVAGDSVSTGRTG